MPDMLRLTRKRFWRLAGRLNESVKEGIEDTYTMIANESPQLYALLQERMGKLLSPQKVKALQGIVGTKAGRQKFTPFLMKRGDSGIKITDIVKNKKDLQDILNFYVYSMERSMSLTKANAQVQPLIEALGRSDSPELMGFGKRLGTMFDNTWGKYDETTANLENALMKTPIFGRLMSKGIVNRSIRRVMGLRTLVDLENPRFLLVNSQQSLQTVFPFIPSYYNKAILEIAKNTSKKDLMSGKVWMPDELKPIIDNFSLGKYGILAKMRPSTIQEKINYTVASTSYYLEGQGKGLVGDELVKYAIVKGIDQSMFVPLIRPGWQKSDIVRLLTQYVGYKGGMLGLMYRVMMEEGLPTQMRFIATNLTLGGLNMIGKGIAVFGVTQIPAVKQAMIKYKEKKKGLSPSEQKALTFLESGWPSLVGIDLTASLTPFDLYGRDAAEKIANLVGGVHISSAIASIKTATNVIQNGGTVNEALARGGLRGMGTMGRQIITAYDLLTSKELRSFSGKPITAPEALTTYNKTMREMGFQTISMTEFYQLRDDMRYVNETKKRYRNRIYGLKDDNAPQEEQNKVIAQWDRTWGNIFPDSTIPLFKDIEQGYKAHQKGLGVEPTPSITSRSTSRSTRRGARQGGGR